MKWQQHKQSRVFSYLTVFVLVARLTTAAQIESTPRRWTKLKRVQIIQTHTRNGQKENESILKLWSKPLQRACTIDIFSVFESVSDNEFVRIANYLKRSSLRKGIRKTEKKREKKEHKCPSQFKSKSTHQKRIQLIFLTSRITFAIKIDRAKKRVTYSMHICYHCSFAMIIFVFTCGKETNVEKKLNQTSLFSFFFFFVIMRTTHLILNIFTGIYCTLCVSQNSFDLF